MNKKLIALAVAAALAPAAALADSGNVVIYGVAHVSYDNISTGASGQDTLNRISSNSSRIGFKGTEDLGNGLSAIWQMEQQIGLDSAAANATPRNQFVGLSSKTMGTLLAGTHDTPYKLATGGLDVFGDTIADYNTIIGNVNGTNVRDLRLGNVVAYITPTWSGFHAAIATSMLNESGNAVPATQQGNPSAWSMAGIYDNGPLFASLAYEIQKSQVVATPADLFTTKGTKLGLGYKFGATKVGFVHERLNDDNPVTANANAGTRNAYLLNVAHTMGANVIKASYGKASDGATAADTSAKNWTIGVDHNLSKRTSVYALYTKTDNAAGATYGVGGAGAGGLYNAAAVGEDPRAFSLGMKHSF